MLARRCVMGTLARSVLRGTALLAAAGPAAATYPDHLVRIVVSAPAGTAPDIVVRLIQPKFAAALGQTVVVENKPGANGGIAVFSVGKSPADGYTLLATVAGTMTANPFLYPKTAAAGLDTVVPVTEIASNDFLLAAKVGLGITTFPAFLDYIRAHPGQVTVGTTAHGSYPHLSAELLKLMTGLDFTIVKHTGGSAAGSAAAAGQIDAVVDTMAVLKPLIDGKLIVPLASSGTAPETGAQTVPTMAASGLKDYALSGWIGIAAPAGTPDDVRARVQAAVQAALADPEVQANLAAMHLRPEGNSPAAFGAQIDRDRQRLGGLIAKAGLTLE